MHKTATGLWSAAVLLVIPMILIAYQLGQQNIQPRPFSFKERIHIWHASATQIPQNPLLGAGIRSTRQQIDAASMEKLANAINRQHRSIWHAHNIFVQTWHGLGAVGAGFLLLVGVLLLRQIIILSATIRPFAYAGFFSATSIAAFGYGMWQSWLMAAYGWSVIFVLLAVRYKTAIARGRA